MGGTLENHSYFFNSKNSKDSLVIATANESIGLIPHSITQHFVCISNGTNKSIKFISTPRILGN